MSIGFTVIVSGSQVRCELADSPLLSHAQDEEMSAVLMGRLYYRSEQTLLRVGGMSDAAVALAGYRRGGRVGLERLEGDFACVVWDGRARKLVGLRDPNGSYPLFWTRRGDEFAVGTHLDRLLQTLGRREIDLEYLAEFLTAPGFGHFEPKERCAYSGVTRVPGGGAVIFDAGPGTVATRHHWDWASLDEDPGSGRVEQLAPLVAERLRAAVRERLVGPTAAHLSGGMDSTAIALMADGMVHRGESGGPLHTFSLTYERLPRLAAERPYVEAGIARLRSATPLQIAGDDHLDFDAYADAPTTDEPFHGLWWIQNEEVVDAAVAAAGARTLLTGYGADLLFEAYPHHLAGLLARGRLFAAWAEAGRWSAFMNRSRWDVLRDFGYGKFGWYRRIGARSTSLTNRSEIAVPPWLDGQFARQYDLAGRMNSQARRMDAVTPDSLRSLTLSGLACQSGDAFTWAVATPLGIHVTHPFQDPRVVALALGIQARSRPEPGRLKPVLAEAMADVLPPEITTRRSKGCFDELYYRGLARNLRRLEAMVHEASIDDLGIFDKAALIRHLEEASLGGPRSKKLIGMELALDAIKWLSARDQRHRNVPEPALVIPWAAANPTDIRQLAG